MELRNRIQQSESELKSLKANIKNDIDNVKYVMDKNTKKYLMIIRMCKQVIVEHLKQKCL